MLTIEVEEIDHRECSCKPLIKEKIKPKERLKFATIIIIGLGFFYLLAMTFYSFMGNDHLKLIFITTKEMIMHFGGLLIGFYFSRK